MQLKICSSMRVLFGLYVITLRCTFQENRNLRVVIIHWFQNSQQIFGIMLCQAPLGILEYSKEFNLLNSLTHLHSSGHFRLRHSEPLKRLKQNETSTKKRCLAKGRMGRKQRVKGMKGKAGGTVLQISFENISCFFSGVLNMSLRLTETSVPSVETTYVCQGFYLPNDTDYHIIGSTPIVNNSVVVHHMLLYACKDVPGTNQCAVCCYSLRLGMYLANRKVLRGAFLPYKMVRNFSTSPSTCSTSHFVNLFSKEEAYEQECTSMYNVRTRRNC